MWQTVLKIPHDWLGRPAQLLWAAAAAAIVIHALSKANRRERLWELWLPLAISGAVVFFVIPFLEVRGPGPGLVPDGPDLVPDGLAIRGYGLMMLAGVASGVGLTLWRAPRRGINPDHAFVMLVAMILSGIAGARLFHVIQNWRAFYDPNPLNVLLEALKINEGGLVVYGAVFGAVAAYLTCCRIYGMPWLKTGDLIAPGMLLGLMLGRIGCLLNGCCHGGLCDSPALAIRFPPGTHPYMQQLEDGALLDMRLERETGGLDPSVERFRAVEVAPGGQAAARGVQPGDIVNIRSGLAIQYALSREEASAMVVVQSASGPIQWTASDLPSRSLPTVPAQIYSSINAALLLLLLLAYEPYRRRHGELFALMLTLYPVTRSLLEVIRTDEPPRWGLTISQWVSAVVICLMVALWVAIARQPKLETAPLDTAPPAAT